MKHKLALLPLLFLFAMPLRAQENISMRAAIEGAVAKVKPALVRIHVVQFNFDDGREYRYEASGSGVIITPEGHVVTNHHVAGNTRRLFCTLADKREIEAELVGTDALSDLAVIRLLGKPGEIFPTASFGDSSLLRVGDPVLAMGSPLSLSQSVTRGIVSNVEMIMPRMFGRGMTLDGEDVGSIVRWIAHDAQIYGGNSGGALVNLEGQLVGINEIKVGLGGAIPGNLARQVAETLMREGAVKRAWLGLSIQPLLKDSPVASGVLVGDTYPGSPAEKAGFQAGDILLRLAGKNVEVRFDEQIPDFNLFAMGLPIGRETEAVVWRAGKEKTLKITPVEREKIRLEGRELPAWGFTARDISLLASKELRRESKDGVLVTGIRPGGPSDEAKPPLAARDIIVSLDGSPVRSTAELEAYGRGLAKGKSEPVPVVVGFDRRGENYLTVVKVGVREWQDPGREVRKAWLPVGIQVLSRDMAEAMKLEGRKGVRVTRVFPRSSAERAGLRVGDILTALDGEEIHASQPEDTEVFYAMVRQYKVGAAVELGVIRGGKDITLKAELEASPSLAREMRKYYDTSFEFSARDIAFLDRMDNKWDDAQAGALVDGVTQGGWAALGGLQVDDLVLHVDGAGVRDVAALEVLMREASSQKRPRMVFRVLRGIHTLFLELEPRWEGAAGEAPKGKKS